MNRPPRRSARQSPLFAQDAQRALESAIEAAEQLAIYYEHRAKQPRRALDLIRVAITELQAAQRVGNLAKDRAAKMESRLSRRLTRLERRCVGALLFGRSQSGNRSVDTTA